MDVLVMLFILAMVVMLVMLFMVVILLASNLPFVVTPTGEKHHSLRLQPNNSLVVCNT